jgi:glycogen phosphorylase
MSELNRRRGSSADSEGLVELALDLRNCWNHTADPIWHKIEPDLWALTHNPWIVLQTASRAKLKGLEGDPEFRSRIRELAEGDRQRPKTPNWFEQAHSASELGHVAYFSMEFGLSEALPIYSGGLGNVAGDQLKAAGDLGVPLVAIGLLYQQGYFRQVLEADGSQHALYPYNDPGQMPVIPVRDSDGEWVRLSIDLPGEKLWLRTWEAHVGRLKLYLLDSNDPANTPAYRGITSELYGGGPDLRLAQELVLGVGGYRLLHVLGIKPDVCHLNEGHAAFAALERARGLMQESGQPFEVALTISRPGNLFTTHTPVEAGFDRFSPELIRRHLGGYAERQLGIDVQRLLALGRLQPEDQDEPFNMAYLAIRCSGAVNAVSRLHGEVSRRIFQPLFPRWPEPEVPIGHVTNGIHTPTWDSAASDALWTERCGSERWRGGMETLADDIRRVSDDALWQLRSRNRSELVDFVRARIATELSRRGGDPKVAPSIFHPETLTLGFARRFATYKRPNLLLHDPQRLTTILTHPDRPVQLVIAGKAHPQDQPGQAMVKAWVRFVQQPNVRRHVVFLSDYDLMLAERLVQGVDLWINTPRRPWEACGTSGMKVLVNGGLNLSELDGWWAEAYSPRVGWALGDGREHGEDPAWDAAEADQLYTLLENEVIPSFYERDESKVPRKWLARVRESMAQLTPRFSANRAVREYTENYYLPAAAAYRDRSTTRGALAASLAKWNQVLADNWDKLRFGELRVHSSSQTHSLVVQVALGHLRPDQVRVEVYASPVADGKQFLSTMTSDGKESDGWRTYVADVPASRPASDYTPRIVPLHSSARIPLENAHILWIR